MKWVGVDLLVLPALRINDSVSNLVTCSMASSWCSELKSRSMASSVQKTWVVIGLEDDSILRAHAGLRPDLTHLESRPTLLLTWLWRSRLARRRIVRDPLVEHSHEFGGVNAEIPQRLHRNAISRSEECQQ